jgi:hypothetical protein
MERVNPKLELLANEYLREYCTVFPVVSTYYGLAEYYRSIMYPTKERIASFIAFLEGLSKRTRAISDQTSEMGKIDQEVLQYVLDLHIFMLQHPPYEESNVNPAELVLGGVQAILDLPTLTDKEKYDIILSRLNQSQSLFETLHSTWENATLLALEDAIPMAQNLGETLAFMLKPLVDRFSQDKLVISDLVATLGRKGKSFAQWLENEVKPRTDSACYVLGKKDYSRLLEIRKEGHTWTERLQMGEHGLECATKNLSIMALRLSSQNGSIEAALSKVRSDLPAVPALEEARNAHKKLVGFLKDKQLLEVPKTEPEIGEPPDWNPFWGEGMMGLIVAELLSNKPSSKIILAPSQTEKGRRELNKSAIVLGVCHEGMAGHYASFVLRKERGNIVRMLPPPETGIDDGWTFYWEQLLREEGIQPTDEYSFYQEYRVFWCSLRHICDVKLHCGLITFEECVRFLEHEGKVPPIMAKAYAKAIARMPGYFSSFITGKNHLIRLREYAKERLATLYSSQLFHKWVGEAGSIPYFLLDREIQERVRVSLKDRG